MKWPLTGGVPSEISLNEDHDIERIYIAGYQDGSVRIWDATFPVLMPMFVLDGKVSLVYLYIYLCFSDKFLNSIFSLPQVAEVNLDGENAVSSLAFCSLNMTLAVGTTSGLVSSSCQMCGLVKIVTCL
jgi:syntaxin-binding protein 5